ncbi:receptor-like protein 19 [Alnus glutinosa]|uniref:receptor-like protein 19 n=1 Tax=Alnus glutinosa TaxID=3517 RepID=UPI002D7A1930|nr:receptor-like protein 19 [Alnus glutinosa]
MLVQNLSELVELYLDGIAISSQGKEWCHVLSTSMPNLRVLSLSKCNLSGPIDFSLQNLKSLSVIQLNGNDFSSPIPIFFADFKNLTSLEVSSSSLNGKFPKKIFQVPTLQTIDLSHDDLRGSLPEFSPNVSLRTMVLNYKGFSRSLPHSIGNLKIWSTIDISNCNFRGSIPNSMAGLTQLVYLDMSLNMVSGSIPVFSMTKNLTNLDLSSNNLTEILDLSYNSLNRDIPVSLFPLPSLQALRLSNNQFSGQLKEFSNISSNKLEELDLSNNELEGPIPISIFQLRGLVILLLSSNNFDGSNLLVEYSGFNLSSSHIPQIAWLGLASSKLKKIPDFCRNQSMLYSLDLSRNQIYGEMPNWIWKLPQLRFLNLTYNYLVTLEGPISNLSFIARSLDFRSNQFQGQLPVVPLVSYLDFSMNDFHSALPASIAINKNHLEGKLPKSLKNCHSLEVLDIGNNHIKETFPFYLNGLALLKVLILRSNKFYGPIGHPKLAPWPMLQIIDVASNNFTGNLPIVLLSTLMAVMNHAHEAKSELNHIQVQIGTFYYQDKLTVSSKGLEVQLVKILTIFTTIDFSCNNFDGPILEEIGEFTLLYILNLSHNAFMGQIPVSLGKLSNLESLDLSSNKLTREIHMQLTNGLIFLSVLNLSFNQLVGHIPFIKQFSTFSENSFKENKRLCGLPLKSQYSHEESRLSPPTYEESHRNMIEWNYISAKLGFVFGFGIVMGPLMFWKR